MLVHRLMHILTGRRTVAVIAAAGLAAVLAAAASATTPPTLTGEFLLGAPVVSATCSPTGVSTLSYSVSGNVAAGPYPGTFTETGIATINPLTAQMFTNGFEWGPVTSFDVFFTIDSPTGQVTGTKQLVLQNSVFGSCWDLSPGHFRALNPDATGYGLHYDATIATGSALYGDSGDAGVLLNDCLGACGETTDVFNEAFRSSSLSTFPLATTGQVTGGGQITSGATFGFTAKSDANGMKGTCAVIDQSSGTKLKCTDVTAFYASGDNVTLYGDALVNGVPKSYRIDVADNAEPGAGADTFAIQAGGYSTSGTLTQGNVQLHG